MGMTTTTLAPTPKLPRYALIALCLFPIAYGLLALCIGQDANWDLRNYHWYNAYAFLNGRYGFDWLPSQTPYFYNPTLDVPFYLLASNTSARVAAFALSFVQGLNFVLLFFITRRALANIQHRDIYALIAATLAMLGGGVLAELGTTFYDNVLSLGVFGSVLLALRALDRELPLNQRTFWCAWIVAGIPVGITTGLKLPSAIFCVGTCFALLAVRGTLYQRFFRAFAFGLGILAGIALSYGHWGYFLWHEYGNPLFPYFNNIFQSPLTTPTSARDIQFVAQGWHKLTLPFEWLQNPLKVGEIPFRDLKLPLLYTLLPLCLAACLLRRRTQSNQAAAYVAATLALAYAAWVFMFCIYRYAVPLEMLAAPVLVIALAYLLPRPRTLAAAMVLLVTTLVATVQPGDWTRVPFGERFVQINLPPIENPAETMILMAGTQPYSHVIPELPPKMPALRLQSNFSAPAETEKGINKILRDRVDAHKGKFLALLPVYDVPWTAKEIMPQFGLKTLVDGCQTVTQNLGEDYMLCPVVKVSQ